MAARSMHLRPLEAAATLPSTRRFNDGLLQPSSVLLTSRPNAALRNGPSQSCGTKFGTYGGNAEIAQDQLSNTYAFAVAAACCHESIGADCPVPLE
jgi:hypothetical protein